MPLHTKTTSGYNTNLASVRRIRFSPKWLMYRRCRRRRFHLLVCDLHEYFSSSMALAPDAPVSSAWRRDHTDYNILLL